MQVEHLTLDEVLRHIEPVTPLEKKLFSMVEEAIDRADEAKNDLDEYECDGDCRACEELQDEVSTHEDTIAALRALLSENDIAHDKI